MWTLVLYDEYGIPLPHNYSDDTLLPSSRSGGIVEYSIVLTTSEDGGRRYYDQGERNVVDVRATAKRGVGIVRVIYPTNEDAFALAKPKLEVLPRLGSDGEEKKRR